MNEIKPSNLKMVLWSDDDYYSQFCNLRRDSFENVIKQTELSNDLVVYGNVEIDGNRKNTLLEQPDNTLENHLLYKNRLSTTWFIDDNDDLWCRDDSLSSGVNYYLYRQTKTNDPVINLKTKLNLALAFENDNYDTQEYLDNTTSIGGLLKDNLLNYVLTDELSTKLKDIKRDEQYAEHCLYMSEVLSSKLNISKDYLLLDQYSEFIKDMTNNWSYWDELNSLATDTIGSMERFIDMNKSVITNELNKFDVNDTGITDEFVKGKEK